MARKLAETFWPGPLTLILPKRDNIPSIVTSGKNTVAVRIPSHPLTLELLNQLDFPLAAMKIVVPNANPGLYLPMALAVTFPFNITFGLPIYYYIDTLT
jgi:L-threonylcarbamoyladenylate synthase